MKTYTLKETMEFQRDIAGRMREIEELKYKLSNLCRPLNISGADAATLSPEALGGLARKNIEALSR